LLPVAGARNLLFVRPGVITLFCPKGLSDTFGRCARTFTQRRTRPGVWLAVPKRPVVRPLSPGGLGSPKVSVKPEYSAQMVRAAACVGCEAAVAFTGSDQQQTRQGIVDHMRPPDARLCPHRLE
jgi:hypothetical protein